MKTLTLLVFICGFTSVGHSQLYVTSAYSYRFGIMAQLVTSDFSTSSSGFYLVDGLYASLGGGNVYGCDLGYTIRDKFIFEASFSYLDGKSITHDFYDSTSGNISHFHRDVSATIYRVAPSIGIKFGRGKLAGYCKSGFVIGINPTMTMRLTRTDESISGFVAIHEQEEKDTGGRTFGFQQRIGMCYSFTSYLSVGIGIEMLFQNWSPTHGELTKSTYNGSDQLAGLPYYYTHYVYVESIIEPNPNAQANDPQERFRPIHSLSSVGVGCTIAYTFNFDKKETSSE